MPQPARLPHEVTSHVTCNCDIFMKRVSSLVTLLIGSHTTELQHFDLLTHWLELHEMKRFTKGREMKRMAYKPDSIKEFY